MLSAIVFPGLGIHLDPSPVAFTVFGKDIYWYGIIIAFGFLMAYVYMSARCRHFGISSDNVIDMLLWAVPIGLVCARIYYCVFYWELYRDNPISCLYVWEGGMAIYGGVLGGIFGLWLCSKALKIPFPVLGDLAAYGVIIGQIFGRWGNFMNREAHGGETDSFLRMGLVGSDGIIRYYHPTFLYESLWNLVGLVLMHFLAKKRKFDGQIMYVYFLWYGLGRAWIEGLRTDSLYLFSTGIRVSQLLAMLFVIFSLAMLFYIFKVKKPVAAELYVNKLQAAAEAAKQEKAAEESAEKPAEEAAEASEDNAEEKEENA
ncbi:MAG: prolipoprotein diacylglyceryl transferase [Oscillospiraceae bacterium]|nr:prolipoprotein diacylglyceryl transferase [Oscillospiraceae bacterium]